MQRVSRIINDSLYRECVERNAVYEKNRRFCRHDLQHMLDVARITYLLVLEACMVGYTLTSDMPGKDFLIKILADANPKERVTVINRPGILRQVKGIIFAAGLLHDIARWVEYESGENHAIAGARIAGEVLSRAGFTDAEQRLITRAIGEHRIGGAEASPLGRYICRADDLARPCFNCAARDDCYKISHMETAGVLLY